MVYKISPIPGQKPIMQYQIRAMTENINSVNGDIYRESWFKHNKIKFTYEGVGGVQSVELDHNVSVGNLLVYDIPSAVQWADIKSVEMGVVPVSLDVELFMSDSFSIPRDLIINSRFVTSDVLLKRLQDFEAQGFPEDYEVAKDYVFLKSFSTSLRALSNSWLSDSFDLDKAIYLAWNSVKGTPNKAYSIVDADENVIVSTDDFLPYINEYSIAIPDRRKMIDNAFKYHFCKGLEMEPVNSFATTRLFEEGSEELLEDMKLLGDLFLNIRETGTSIQFDSHVERKGFSKFFGNRYDLQSETSDLRIYQITKPLPEKISYPGMETSSYYGVIVDGEPVFEIKVIDGYYNDSLNLIDNKRVEFGVPMTNMSLLDRKKILFALSTMAITNYPEEITVNVTPLNNKRVSDLVDVDVSLPTVFKKFQFTGDKSLDRIIENINKFEITTLTDVDKATVEIERGRIESVINGAVTIINNKDKVADSDSKLSRVAFVLDDYLKTLEVEVMEKTEVIELDDFEIALRLLEDSKNHKL